MGNPALVFGMVNSTWLVDPPPPPNSSNCMQSSISALPTVQDDQHVLEHVSATSQTMMKTPHTNPRSQNLNVIKHLEPRPRMTTQTQRNTSGPRAVFAGAILPASTVRVRGSRTISLLGRPSNCQACGKGLETLCPKVCTLTLCHGAVQHMLS